MKTYELTYIISPETTSEELEAKAREIDSNVQNKEGVIIKHTNPLARVLSYPVAKRASGFLGVVEFQIEPENLPELEKTFKKDGKIVRHMVIIKEASQMKKAKRTREGSKYATPKLESKEEPKPEETEVEAKPKAKVELKDIEQKLDEILGE